MQRQQLRREGIKQRVSNLVNNLKRLLVRYVSIERLSMANKKELEKQIEVLTDTNKLLTQVIHEKNDMIHCLEVLFKAEEYADGEIPPKEEPH